MSLRRFATGAALAIAGLLAAAGIGLLANSISGDNVGLSAEPLSAGETLAPSADDRRADRADQQAARERRRKRLAARRADEAGTPTTTGEAAAPAAPAPTTTTEDNSGSGSDSSGQGRGRGRGRSGGDSGSDDD
jgi:hypothetical protein